MSAHPEAWLLNFALSLARRRANEIRAGEFGCASFERGYVCGVANIATTVCYGERIDAAAVRNEVRYLMDDYSRRTA